MTKASATASTGSHRATKEVLSAGTSFPGQKRAFIPPTLEMLRATIWSMPSSSDEAEGWRDIVEQNATPIERDLTVVGPRTGPDGQKMYPGSWNKQILVDGLFRRQLRGTRWRVANPNDQNDLARWLGTTLAFAHNLGKNEESAHGGMSQRGRSLYGIIGEAIGEVARVAWYSQKLPDWANRIMESLLETRLTGRVLPLYRTTPEIQKTLTVLLTSFFDHIPGGVTPQWGTKPAVRGIVALRLLAGTVPGLVDDHLGELLGRLEVEFNESEPLIAGEKDLPRIVQAAWERSLLERVDPAGVPQVDPENEAPHESDHVLTSKPLSSPLGRHRSL